MNPPRWVLAVIGVGVLVVAADVGLFFAAHDGTTAARADAAATGRVLVVDPGKRRVVDTVDVGHLPTRTVTGFGAVWVLNRGDGTLSHIDAGSHRVVATLTPDATANDIAVGAGGVWVAGPPRGGRQPLEVADIERIDPRSGAIDRSFLTSTGASALAAGGGALWTTGYLGHYVRGAARSDARTGAMSEVSIGIYGDLVAADDDAAYWVGSIASRIARVSTRTGRMTASMPLASDESVAAGNLPPNPTDVAIGGGAVWISTTDGTIVRVDAKLHGVAARIPACSNALAIAYGLGIVWVACSNGTLVPVDPASDEPGEPIALDGRPRAVAAGEGAVWVAVE